MARRRVTFEVDTSVLFDRLAALGGDAGPLGAVLASVLMSDASLREEIALQVYGIEVAKGTATAKPTPTET